MEDDDEETKSKFQDASMLSDFESKQTNILSGLKSKMQNDLEITMAKMAADHVCELLYDNFYKLLTWS